MTVRGCQHSFKCSLKMGELYYMEITPQKRWKKYASWTYEVGFVQLGSIQYASGKVIKP